MACDVLIISQDALTAYQFQYLFPKVHMMNIYTEIAVKYKFTNNIVIKKNNKQY